MLKTDKSQLLPELEGEVSQGTVDMAFCTLVLTELTHLRHGVRLKAIDYDCTIRQCRAMVRAGQRRGITPNLAKIDEFFHHLKAIDPTNLLLWGSSGWRQVIPSIKLS